MLSGVVVIDRFDYTKRCIHTIMLDRSSSWPDHPRPNKQNNENISQHGGWHRAFATYSHTHISRHLNRLNLWKKKLLFFPLIKSKVNSTCLLGMNNYLHTDMFLLAHGVARSNHPGESSFTSTHRWKYVFSPVGRADPHVCGWFCACRVCSLTLRKPCSPLGTKKEQGFSVWTDYTISREHPLTRDWPP